MFTLRPYILKSSVLNSGDPMSTLLLDSILAFTRFGDIAKNKQVRKLNSDDDRARDTPFHAIAAHPRW